MSGDLFGSKSNTVTTNSTSTPWNAPYLNNLYGNASSIYSRGPYQGPYITAQSPFTPYAQQLTAEKAQDPNSLINMSQQQLGDTISGQYLNANSNPYFKASVDDALGQARSQFASMYAGQSGGNLTNSGFQEGLQRNLANVATNAYAQNYARERQNQLEATRLAPSMDYANIDRLAQIGAQQEARGQAEIGAQQAAYMSPWENLAQYAQALKVGSGGTGSQQTPYFTNPTASALGTGIMGMQAYQMAQKLFGGGGGGVNSGNYDSSGTFVPTYTGYDMAGGPAYG